MSNLMMDAIRAQRERQEHELRHAVKLEALVGRIVASGIDPDALDERRLAAFADAASRAGRDSGPSAGAAQRRTPSRPSGSGAASLVPAAPEPTREQIRAFVLQAGRLVTRRDVFDAFEGSRDLDRIGGKLQRLARAGEIEPLGTYGRRAYRAPRATPTEPMPPARASAPAAPPAARPVASVAPCTGPEDMLRIVAQHEPVTSERLRDMTGRSWVEIGEWGHELTCRGALTFEREGRARIWRLAPQQDLADQVVATIAADPGALDERRIALTLNAPAERVGSVCADLLDRAVVELTERDTYVLVAA